MCAAYSPARQPRSVQQALVAMPADALTPPLGPRLRVGVWLATVLFFMMLFLPAAYQPIKAVLLALVLAAIVAQALTSGGLPLHRAILIWTLFTVATSLAFMLRGAINGAPGALQVGTVYALWPLVYTVLIAGAATQGVLITIIRVLVVATIAIGLYGVSYILHVVGWMPDFLYIPFDQGQRIGFYKGFVEFNLDSLASLLFLVPFVVSALMTWPKSEAPVSRPWLWIALIMGAGLVALSGRRALQLVVVLSPLFALLLRSLLPREERRASRKLVVHFLVFGAVAMIGGGVVLHFVFGFSLGPVVEMFKRGFAFESYVRAVPRKEQFLNLLGAWTQSPVLGAGHGAVAPGWLRSEDMPWAYELSYVALLFHTGLLGFLVYAAGVAWIIATGLRIIREGNRLGLCMLSVLVGTVCFLVANTADPYLEKYDYMWVIFLPVAFINIWLRTRAPLHVAT
jgi:hypothetical protein